jgi:hypothetical protein
MLNPLKFLQVLTNYILCSIYKQIVSLKFIDYKIYPIE